MLSRDFATVASSTPGQPQKKVTMKTTSVQPKQTSTADIDADGFIKVQKKRRHRAALNRCGIALTGNNFLLRAATPTTPLYVSRLKAEDIVEYITVKSRCKLRVSLLESRHNTNFRSFVVRVPTEKLDTFLKEDFWPKGVVFRRYRGALPPDPAQRK